MSNELSSLNVDFLKTQMSESDAKKRFNSICTEVENKVNALELPVLDDTYCVLVLTHAVADPNGKNPTIASKKINFTSKAE